MKTATLKYAALALTTLTLGLGATWLLHESSGGRLGIGAQAAGSAEGGEEGAAALPTRRFREGESFVYDLDTTRSTHVTSKVHGDHRVSMSVAGTLRLTVIGAQPDAIHLRADMTAADVELSPDVDADGAAWASRTFYLSANPRGEIQGFFFPAEVPAPARLLLRGIVQSLQVVVPHGHGSTWSTMEQDVSGQYEAAYRVTSDLTVEKSKSRYVRTRGLGGLLPIQKDAQYVVGSAATFDLDASGWPASLAEKETLDVTVQATHVRGQIETRARLAGIEQHPEWIGPLPAGLESDAETEAAAIALSKKQADLNMVGGKSFADITAELRAESSKTRNQAQARMAALFRVDPDQAEKALREILHGESDPNAKKRLIAALGTAGTPEAQHQLATLLDMPEAGDRRVNAAIALSLTKEPTQETADALQKAMSSPDKDVASTAALASGNVARSMNEGGSADTADAVQRLVDALAAASSDAERSLYLKALGNTGDPRAFAAILPYLSSDSAMLRAVAAGSLRFMEGAAADAAIVAAMKDPESTVRKAAAHTLAFRPISDISAAVDALFRVEPSEAVRTEILKGLHVKLSEDPSIVETIEWALQNDPSESVRSLAKDILSHLPTDGG